jgi:fatty acid desaturase
MHAYALPVLTDPRQPAPPTLLDRLSDRVFLPLIADPRDVIFTRLLTRLLLQVVPMAVGLFFLPAWAVGLLAFPYLAFVFARFGGPVMLGLHAVTHRPLFRKPLRPLDRVLTHLLPPLWGMTPFAYRAHHVYMHHSEGNGHDDLSSTASYERDNPWHFAHYWARFTFFGYLHLSSWLWRRGRKDAVLRMVLGETVVYGIYGLLLWVNPAAALVVLVLPYLMLRFFMMAGNWTEHAFVDASDPANDFRNSTCLLNTRYNHRCYNAGYHLIHHRLPGLHWADTPAQFERLLPHLVEQDSIVFDGVVNNQQIFWKLMAKDYDFLAEHLVDIGGRRPSKEEKIAFLKSRTRGTSGSFKGMVERREAA